MSQPRPGKGQGSNANRAGGQRRSSGGTRPAPSRGSARPDARRIPAAPPPSGFRAQIDRILPPFTAQRYIAIWLVFMIPLVAIILVLANPFGGKKQDVPVPAPITGAGTGSTAMSVATHNCQAPAQAGKYFVIDTAKGCIVAKLYTDPSANVTNTIANFEKKANSGYFNGLTFHRVLDWVIQGGDPLGNGQGGGKMPAEYNQLPFQPGALGVARGQDQAINNDSQFFIVKDQEDRLNGLYTNFGQVVQGMDVVNQIAIGDKIIHISVTERK